MVVIVEEVIVIAIEDTVVILIVNLSFHGVRILGRVIVNTAESTEALVRLGIVSRSFHFIWSNYIPIFYISLLTKVEELLKRRKIF